MAALVSIVLFAIIASVVLLYGHRAYVRPARFFEQLSAERAPGKRTPETKGARTAVRVVEQLGAALPVSKEAATLARRDLIAAGFRSEKAVAIYYGIRLSMSVAALAAAMALVSYVTHRVAVEIPVLVAAAALGYVAPLLILEKMVSARQRRLRIGLPDALDLMVIAVESGVGIDQTFVSVTTELRDTHRDVTDELSLVMLEMRAGTSRIEALHNLATRTCEPEVRKLVAVLAQTDRFGTSISEALRAHADFMRVTRRLAAEEKAGKLGVKLVFPIFFLILPSMALVVAGPGLLQVARVLLPALANVK